MMPICSKLEGVAGAIFNSRICTSQAHSEGGLNATLQRAWELHSMHMNCSKSLMHCGARSLNGFTYSKAYCCKVRGKHNSFQTC